ncbi:hypothetical protein C3L33_04405, partial [Rhododendron williamsianum]
MVRRRQWRRRREGGEELAVEEEEMVEARRKQIWLGEGFDGRQVRRGGRQRRRGGVLQALGFQRPQDHLCQHPLHLLQHSTSASSLISTATISDGHDGCGFTVAGDPGSYLARFRSVGSETLSDLIKKLDGQGPRVDGLVYDPFLPWALDVAREFGLVGAAFFTQSCAVSNVYYHVRKGILKLPFEEGKAILVPGLPPLERSETPSFVGDYGSFPAFCDMLVNQFSNIDKADWVLFNTFYDLEEEVRYSGRIRVSCARPGWLLHDARLHQGGPITSV